MKLALCNEVLAGRPLAEQCRLAAALGYQGLEIAPFTLAPDPFALGERDGAAWRAAAAAHGIAVSSLHWLLARPEGLSLTTGDAAVRSRTIALLRRLIDVAAAAGARVLVHGSPMQRAPQPGQSVADALARLEDALAQLAPQAHAAGVTYCIEPLSPAETPVINTLAEAAALVDRVGSPALRTMLDVSAASQAESEAPAVLLARYLASGHVAHVQFNDRNRRGPGQGQTRHAEVVQVLRSRGYEGWVAVEPFLYEPDGLSAAAFAAGYVRGLLEAPSPRPSSPAEAREPGVLPLPLAGEGRGEGRR
jgi:D-psicose/D-tagatose/L-ribulose 3-epimerase